MTAPSIDTFGARSALTVGNETFDIFRLSAVARDVQRLPYALRVLLEGLLRHEDGVNVTADHIRSVADWTPQSPAAEIPFFPGRVLMPDSTGVPCIVDLAAMREAVAELGGDPRQVEPQIPAELVIDHSVVVDAYARPDAFAVNVGLEHDRNQERYQLLRWGQSTFGELMVVPPGAGIVHQVNLERLARGVITRNGQAFPDSCVGTDSHTPMVNGLGVLGWGVGGIEAESALLGQPLSLLIPDVVGLRLVGALQPGVTATDLVLTITESLRRHGVVGKFVEFFGAGLASVSVPNRATIANMSPEYGSTVALFPIDTETIRFLELTGRPAQQVRLVEEYARAQGLWHDPTITADYSQVVDFDLGTVVPSVAGPRRPQDRIDLAEAKAAFACALSEYTEPDSHQVEVRRPGGETFTLDHGAVTIAAITSCTNTSNPTVMVTAGLLARNAVEHGLSVAPWVKTSLAPGSRAVTEYLDRAGLTSYLDNLDIPGP
ncbi:aconitate hydratase AcnA [Mycolicibacterium neoaurum]|nr:aconitate hydratase AcnA [Mycolicibacterium neoaurum]